LYLYDIRIQKYFHIISNTNIYINKNQGIKKDKKPMTPFTPLAPPGSGPKKGLLAPPPSSGLTPPPSNNHPPSFQSSPQIPQNNNTNVFDNFNTNNSNIPKSDPFGDFNKSKSDNSDIPKSDPFGMSPSFATPIDPFAIPATGNKQQMSKSDLLDLFNK
jgi:hypothetical protein